MCNLEGCATFRATRFATIPMGLPAFFSNSHQWLALRRGSEILGTIPQLSGPQAFLGLIIIPLDFFLYICRLWSGTDNYVFLQQLFQRFVLFK